MQGLEVGILVGIMMCAVNFAYEYSVLSLVAFTVLPSQSTSMLPFRHRQILSLFHGNMVAVSVSGAAPFCSCWEQYLGCLRVVPRFVSSCSSC